MLKYEKYINISWKFDVNCTHTLQFIRIFYNISKF